jgi:hypothetical protein
VGYADPARLRADAVVLARTGQQLSDQAERFVRSAAETAWQSSAADAMRRHVREEAVLLGSLAGEFAAASSALIRHAVAVEAMQERIASIEHIVHTLASVALGSALSVVAAALHGAGQVADRLRSLLADLPASGDPAWLEVPDLLRRLGIPCAG